MSRHLQLSNKHNSYVLSIWDSSSPNLNRFMDFYFFSDSLVLIRCWFLFNYKLLVMIERDLGKVDPNWLKSQVKLNGKLWASEKFKAWVETLSERETINYVVDVSTFSFHIAQVLSEAFKFIRIIQKHAKFHWLWEKFKKRRSHVTSWTFSLATLKTFNHKTITNRLCFCFAFFSVNHIFLVRDLYWLAGTLASVSSLLVRHVGVNKEEKLRVV